MPRRYQPVGRNVTLLCHLLDSVASVASTVRSHMALWAWRYTSQDNTGAPCGSGDFFSMPPKPCVVTGAGMTITNPRRGCSGPDRASLFDRPPAGVRDPDAGDLDRLAASLQALAPSSPASVIRAGRAARLKETPTVKAGRVKCVFGGSLGVVLDKRPPCS